ncbi:histidine kinase [Nitrosopumilus piranensis]|uniref:Uncharacterized protein n=1 Tax=Nitrosopumilus piranensis TaxID=1582439 RepID=A0A0C5BV70_9ARCH|nr:histidine kinase [Nitrosopumilus piranensis]AJM92156.1 conserved membrane protein of unknown function [Nitrosopumilus piranensis]
MDTVPEKLSNPISLRAIILILSIVLGFHFLVNFIEDTDLLVYGFSLIIPGSVSIFSFIVARKYSDSLVFSRSYYFLAFGFASLFLAELTYLIYDLFLGIDPYPSIADVFFFIFYPMISLFVFKHIQFFSSPTSISDKIILGIIPVAITTLYLSITISEEFNFDFFYGILFVSATSISFALSIYALKIFQGSLVGTSWIIMVAGILILVGGDIWYYYIELFEEYTLSHTVNVFWYLGYLVILYSLIKHRSSL